MSALKDSKDLTRPRPDKVSVSLVIVVIQYGVVYEDFSFICIKTVFRLSVKFFEILLLADSHPSVLKGISFLSFKQFLYGYLLGFKGLNAMFVHLTHCQ